MKTAKEIRKFMKENGYVEIEKLECWSAKVWSNIEMEYLYFKEKLKICSKCGQEVRE